MNKKQIIKFLMEWNELWLLPISFLLLLGSDPFLKMVDPTAGSFDIGILQAVLVATFCVVWAWSLAWIAYKLSFPPLAKWLDDIMEAETKARAILPMAVYWLYVFSFIMVLISVI